MREIISVEYISRSSSKKDKDDKAFLDGFIGEVDKSAYIRALRECKIAEQNGTGPVNPKLPVRFCLNVPGSIVGYYPGWKFDDADIAEQGIPISVKSLKPSKRLAISKYERRRLPPEAVDVRSIFEKPVYYYSNSRSTFFRQVGTFHNQNGLAHSWVWSKESRVGDQKKPLVFMEGRIYGADTVLPVYSTSRFCGLIIQIISRDLAAGYPERMTSDIYLIANTREYVEYVDGVSIERERMTPISGLSDHFISPKKFMEQKIEEKKKAEAATKAAAEAASIKETAAKGEV